MIVQAFVMRLPPSDFDGWNIPIQMKVIESAMRVFFYELGKR